MTIVEWTFGSVVRFEHAGLGVADPLDRGSQRLDQFRGSARDHHRWAIEQAQEAPPAIDEGRQARCVEAGSSLEQQLADDVVEQIER
jgi:hypothetical protein